MKQRSKNNIQCPGCNSSKIVKKGIRKNKLQSYQQYKCKECNKIFNKKFSKNKTYQINLILKCISQYNLGFPLKEVKQKLKTEATIPTLSNWINEFKEVCPFHRLRQEAKQQFQPEELIHQHVFLRNNLNYKFKIHNFKLNYLTKDNEKLQRLRQYLEKIPTSNFPHHIFKPTQEINNTTRASQSRFKTLKIITINKQNLANKLCALALNLAKNNKQRHEKIQEIMLANDSTTIATEIPIYLTHDDLLYFKSRNFNLNPDDFNTPITGHIDILQIRNNLIHILDLQARSR